MNRMLKRLLPVSLILVAILFFPLTVLGKGVSPTPTPTPEIEEEEYDFESMTTYEMFWPIVAGKVPGDRFYTLKLWRDKLGIFLFFDALKKSEYLKQLANKRLLESEKLVEIKRFSFLSKTLEQSYEKLNKGLRLLTSQELTPQAFWLAEEYKKDLEKHWIILNRMKEKTSGEDLKTIDNALEKIKGLVKDYKLEVTF